MNAFPHVEIARQAESLWRARGCPVGRDLEIWLEVEQQLSQGSPPAGGRQPESFTERAKAETAAESVVEYYISPAGSEQEAIQAAMQKPDPLAPKAKPPRRFV